MLPPKPATYSSRQFTWDGQKGYSDFDRLGLKWFPEGDFYIHSRRSNTLMRFTLDHETMEANEFFDGEMEAFHAPGTDIKVIIQQS